MKNILQPLVKQFMPFAQERMGFDKPPRLFLRNDTKNAQNPLGKTAYYDPEQMSVTLYIDGRHPKDIMRSLSHELVHHTQNCNGQFDHVGEMGEGYAQNDEHLREMERQAYEEGNLCFRDWEDSVKGTIYNESLQKGAKNKMSFKQWKDKEISTILTEKWGFSFNLLAESQEEDVVEEASEEDTLNEEEGEEVEEGVLKVDRKQPNYKQSEKGAKETAAEEERNARLHAYYDKQDFMRSFGGQREGQSAGLTEDELEERRGRGRDREGMEPDSRRRPMGEGEDKKPDEDGDGVPDWADKKPGEDDHTEDKKESVTEAKVRQLIRKLVKEAAKRGR